MLFSCSGDGSNDRVNNSGLEKGDGLGGSLAVFALVGDYLYTVDHSSLNVFAVVNQSDPVKVNTVVIGSGDIETLFAHGNNLYIGSQNGMYIYSLADPENPVQVTSVQHFTACDPVEANDTHSFVTLHSNTFCGNNVNQLQIYNTADRANPVLVSSRDLIYPKGLGLYGNYLFVCDDTIKIFDVSNPANPVQAQTINKACFDVIIRGDELYAIGEGGLYRYQLNPTDITQITYMSEISL
ncbi:hypothetical protein HYN59_08920 [Flavobacterium album]|uniref:LVIVD repeat-containing protein n=2 Tax=Flavobacterium album TaxID=2175091 RepID=A0A2S1R320_9FLAO|nr:hypothetical protein HYN59_08920 [Flavobacterium album]